MVDKLFDLIFSNLKNPKLYGILLVLAILYFWLFPYLDANLFYYKRINDRVDVLAKISALDENSIQSNPALQKEYDNILVELSNQPENLVINIFTEEKDSAMKTAKFVTGSLLSWLLAVYSLFSKKAGKLLNRFLSCILLVVFGIVFGFIASSIPNFFNPIVNCIGMPILQFVIAALFITNGKKLNKSSDK